ncbi:MAG: glycosyltransferase family 4 protein [Rikenellaceae bacterium]
MRVAYLYHSTCNSGGVERILCDKTHSLIERGVEIVVITTNQRGRDNFYQFNDKIEFFDLDINYDLSDRSQIRNCVQTHFERLDALLKRLSVDITISMFDVDVNFIHKLTDGSKKIVEIHGPKYFCFQILAQECSGLKFLTRAAKMVVGLLKNISVLRKVDKFVVLTEQDKKLWFELDNIECIPNFSRVEYRDDILPDYSEKRVVSVGRLVTQKGFEYLIDAWSIVKKSYPDWKLSIYGDGNLRDKLQSQIDRLGLSDVITLEGTTKEISKEYLASSMYVLSSVSEGLAIVLLEAMILKLPVVSFACQCGPRDLIDHNETGLLVDRVGDTTGLAQAMMELMASEERRKKTGLMGYDKSKLFHKDIIIDKWVALFNNLVGK